MHQNKIIIFKEIIHLWLQYSWCPFLIQMLILAIYNVPYGHENSVQRIESLSKVFNLSKDIEMEYHMHVIHFTIDFKFLFLNIVS